MTRGPTSRKTKGVVKSEKTPRKAKKVPCLSLCKPKTPDNTPAALAALSEMVELCRAIRTALNVIETRSREVYQEILPAVGVLKKNVVDIIARLQLLEISKSEQVGKKLSGEVADDNPTDVLRVVRELEARVREVEHRMHEFDNIHSDVQEILSQAGALAR